MAWWGDSKFPWGEHVLDGRQHRIFQGDERFELAPAGFDTGRAGSLGSQNGRAAVPPDRSVFPFQAGSKLT